MKKLLNNILFSKLFLLMFMCTFCADNDSDNCGIIEISQNSDFEKYKDCTKADEVYISGDTTNANGLNKLKKVTGLIGFFSPDDEEELSSTAPIISITGFKKLESLGVFRFHTDDSSSQSLIEFDAFQNLIEINSIYINCFVNQESQVCGPINLKEIKGFEKLNNINYEISISGENIETLPDFNLLKAGYSLSFFTPNVNKIPEFKSLKKIETIMELDFSCNFSENQIKEQYSGIESQDFPGDFINIYNSCN